MGTKYGQNSKQVTKYPTKIDSQIRKLEKYYLTIALYVICEIIEDRPTLLLILVS